MSDFSFRWTAPPSIVGTLIRRRAAQVVPALTEYAASEAERMATEMKQNRPWTDRTNAARAGLFGAVEADGNQITILVGGTVDYQPYLELGTVDMAPRPIIMPTLQRHAPQTVQGAAELVRRIMAGG